MLHVTKAVAGGLSMGSLFLVTTVDSTSLIPIGAAIVIMMSIGAAVWRISKWVAIKDARDEQLDRRLESNAQKMTQIVNDLNSLRTERRYDTDLTQHIDTIPSNAYRATVLVVDDSAEDRFIVRRNLERVQFSVLEATTLKEARAVLKNHTIDCVLLDLNLPDSLADHTVSEFVREYPNAVCIALTGNEDPNIQATALAAGADAFVYKMQTADPAYLPRMIGKAMGRRALKRYSDIPR